MVAMEASENKLMPGPFPTLSVVVGTYNRLHLLRRCLMALVNKVDVEHEIVVIDAGSTDGTIEYLEGLQGIRLVCDGKRLGQARSYNRVFQTLTSKYVCWLSDDNVLRDGMLDLAVSILEEHPEIGMVALKTRDVIGPFQHAAYIGGISSVGILNCNQGVIRNSILRKVGYFGEEFRDYGIDSDLTAKVLLKGWQVVYTKEIAINHYREWMMDTDSADYQKRMERQTRSLQLYHEKYEFLDKFSFFLALKRSIFPVVRSCQQKVAKLRGSDEVHRDKMHYRILLRMFVGIASFFQKYRNIVASEVREAGTLVWIKVKVARLVGIIEKRLLGSFINKRVQQLGHAFQEAASGPPERLDGYCLRDWHNVLQGRYISIWDPYKSRKKPFYLVQHINSLKKWLYKCRV